MAFCAAIATAVTLGACGSGLPGNAVVQIGQASITMAALNHWLAVANDSTQTQTGAKAPALPLPPNYTACVAAAEKAAGNTATSRTSSAVAGDKAACAANYQTLVTEVLEFLIPEMWIQGEAYDRHVHVTQKQIEAGFEAERKSASPPLETNKELTAFLAASGQTVADLKWRTMVSLLGNKIELAVIKTAQKVTSKQIAAYYAKNHAQYTTPATRNLHIVLVTSLASAQKVRSLLASGESYKTVATKYSVDATSKANGGAMVGVTSTELNAQLNAAVQAAPVGQLSQPVKTAFGYYVFTVDKVTPSKTETLAQASASIKTLLSQQQVSAAETKLQDQLEKKWEPRTQCRSGTYQVAYCANPPKGSTGATGAG
jgi:foldase protein PrsA